MCRALSHLISANPYKFIAIVITLCLLGGCAKRAETSENAPRISRDAIENALKESERLFGQRENIDNLRQAVAVLGKVRDPDNRDYEVEWKYAKYCFFLGKVETDQAKATELFEKGQDAAKIASRVANDRVDGHFWFAANLGELARMSPITVGIKSVDEIRESMEKVVSIDPSYQGASAFDALGQLEMGTRNFKGGSAEKAVEYYKRGMELAPANSNTRLHLAEAYFALKRDNEAKAELDQLIAMKPDQEFALEHAAAVAKAKELLSKNF